MTTVYVESVGLYAPGLQGWSDSRGVLTGQRPYQQEPLPRYKPACLPPNERRRATDLVRLAFGACEDAVAERVEEAARLAAVFAASGGDYTINDQICRALNQPQRMVSPTQFHNSVHNAAAGYWSIATGSRAASVSLSAYDYTVAAGFIEAISLVAVESCETLLALYDNSVCWPMQAARPVKEPFSAALWLTPCATQHSLASITLSISDSADSYTGTRQAGLEPVRLGNPAARCLPVLEHIAANSAGQVMLEMACKQALCLDVQPC